MQNTLTALAAASTVAVASADVNPVPYAGTVVTATPNGDVQVTVIADGVFRVVKSNQGIAVSSFTTNYSTYQVVNRRNSSATEDEADNVFTTSSDGSKISTKNSAVTVDGGTTRQVQFDCDGEQWTYGGPSTDRTDPMMATAPINKYGYFAFNDAPTPLLVQKEKRGPPFLDIMWWDHPDTANIEYDLYFMCYGTSKSAATYARGMQQFTLITGKAALMPMAQYGMQYNPCCVTADGSQESTNLPYFLARLKANDIPVDLYVMDFNWHSGPHLANWGGYSWNEINRPDWRTILQGLKNGSNPYGAPIPLMSNVHPGASSGGGKQYDISQANTEAGAWGRFSSMMGDSNSSGLLKPDGSYITNYYDQKYTESLWVAIIDTVMDYIWIDCAYQCKPQHGTASGVLSNHDTLPPANLDFNTHALYAFGAMLMAQNKRPLALLRPPGSNGINVNIDTPNSHGRLQGNLGAHRTPMSWTGDTDLSPDKYLLTKQIKYFAEACAMYLFCGLSSDLGPMNNEHGGLYQPVQTYRYIRIMQWGAFTASFRMHSGTIAPPWVKYTTDERRWLANPMRLRGSLVPYTYTMAANSSRESWPFVRPMWWDFDEAAAAAGEDAHQMPGQYMFGDFLVNPVPTFVEGHKPIADFDVSVWLPPGLWVEFEANNNTANVEKGPQTLKRSVSINQVPVYVPLGTVIPMWPPGRRTVSPVERPVLWTLWLGEHNGQTVTSGSGQMYEDDGVTLDYLKGTDKLLSTHDFSYTLENSKGTASLTAMIVSSNKEMAPTKTHGVQLRGVSGTSAKYQCCESAGTQCTSLNAGSVGDYTQPGWWTMDQPNSEFATPAGSVNLICPMGHNYVQVTGIKLKA